MKQQKRMLRVLADNIGFNPKVLKTLGKRLKVGIIDADLLDHGTRHPNLALEKIAGYCKSLGHEVRLICDYNELDIQLPFFPDSCDYDVLCLAQVFKFTKRPKVIDFLIKNHFIFTEERDSLLNLKMMLNNCPIFLMKLNITTLTILYMMSTYKNKLVEILN